MLAVTTDREGAPRGELLRWGLVPTWAKGPDTGLKMINARLETADESPAFRRAFERYRCLIVADGFYEWRADPAASTRGRRAPKQPFHITRADGGLFAFAGLWSIWYGDDEQKIRSCAILTVPANSAIAPLHDRMPGDPRARARSRTGWMPPPPASTSRSSPPASPLPRSRCAPSAWPSTTHATTARSAWRGRCTPLRQRCSNRPPGQDPPPPTLAGIAPNVLTPLGLASKNALAAL